jgi:predicted metal-dependent phosphoesterase TrpH
MLKFARNKIVDVSLKDLDTFAVHGVLDDDIYSVELDVRVRIGDLEILEIDGKWHRWTTPECPRATQFLQGAVGLRIGQDGFGPTVHKVVGRKACRHFANLLLECCHSAKEATKILDWEKAKAENPHLKLEEFRQESTPQIAASAATHSVQTEEAPRRHAKPTRKADRDPSAAKMTIDLHVHTYPASSCSSAPVDALIEEAKRIGLDGICLTDHNHVWNAAEVKELRHKHGFLVLRGNEITTNQGDVLVFGLEKDVQGIVDLKELRWEVDEAGGFMIVAHPFRGFLVVGVDEAGLTPEKAMERPLFKYADAVEVLNGKVTEKENDFASRVTDGLGLLGTGGSDAHEVAEVGMYATEFYAEINNEEDLIAALQEGACSPVVFQAEKQIGARPSSDS